MNLKTKQRVIGGLVLLALVAIFSPLLFHHTKSDSSLNLPTTIPTAPNQPTVDLQLPVADQAAVENPSKPISPSVQTASAPINQPVNQPAVQSTSAPTSQPASQPVKTSSPSISQSSKPVSRLTQNPSHPLVSVTSVPAAWVIQLGSFADKANAQHLVKKLQTEGFDTYLRVIKTKKGIELTKVFIGPEINLKKIQRIQTRLTKEFKLNGVIKRYQV